MNLTLLPITNLCGKNPFIFAFTFIYSYLFHLVKFVPPKIISKLSLPETPISNRFWCLNSTRCWPHVTSVYLSKFFQISRFLKFDKHKLWLSLSFAPKLSVALSRSLPLCSYDVCICNNVTCKCFYYVRPHNMRADPHFVYLNPNILK